MEPLGACSPETTLIKTPDITHYNNKRPNEDASKPVESDDYLITFMPIVVIVLMILIVSILYKRRRTGKMSVGDDEQRQAFRSKGIPVMFQDELDEKPNPSNKSMVVLKKEKPPLLPPPEYKGMNLLFPLPPATLLTTLLLPSQLPATQPGIIAPNRPQPIGNHPPTFHPNPILGLINSYMPVRKNQGYLMLFLATSSFPPGKSVIIMNPLSTPPP